MFSLQCFPLNCEIRERNTGVFTPENLSTGGFILHSSKECVHGHLLMLTRASNAQVSQFHFDELSYLQQNKKHFKSFQQHHSVGFWFTVQSQLLFHKYQHKQQIAFALQVTKQHILAIIRVRYMMEQTLAHCCVSMFYVLLLQCSAWFLAGGGQLYYRPSGCDAVVSVCLELQCDKVKCT